MWAVVTLGAPDGAQALPRELPDVDTLPPVLVAEHHRDLDRVDGYLWVSTDPDARTVAYRWHASGTLAEVRAALADPLAALGYTLPPDDAEITQTVHESVGAATLAQWVYDALVGLRAAPSPTAERAPTGPLASDLPMLLGILSAVTDSLTLHTMTTPEAAEGWAAAYQDQAGDGPALTRQLDGRVIGLEAIRRHPAE